MFVQIKSIQFDFEYDGEILPLEEQQHIISNVVGSVLEVEEEGEIVDIISDNTGWLVSSLDYDILGQPQEYEVYVDVEHKSWQRVYFKVTAVNEFHADRIAKDIFKCGGWEALDTKFGADTWESLDDASEETGVQQLFRDDNLISEIGS